MPELLRDQNPARRVALRLAARRTALVAGIFCAVLAILLGFNSVRLYRGAGDGRVRLVEAEAILPLKAELREDPGDAALKHEIRRLDQQLRLEYFRRGQLASRGGWMLVAGAVVFIAALHLAGQLAPARVPVPSGPPVDSERRQSTAARAVGGSLIVLAGMTSAIVWGARVRPPGAVPADEPSGSAPGPRPALAAGGEDWTPAGEVAENWPRFRGPGGLGVAECEHLPESWNGETGSNLLWKTEVPLPGESSPLVWGDRIFLSGADPADREIYCFSAEDGHLAWTVPVTTPQGSRGDPPDVMMETGYAASTAVTDGRRVFAMFANGEIAGASSEGELLWSRYLGEPRSAYGHASSLAMWRNFVIVVYDRGGDPESGLSKILALDAATGTTVWSTPRPVPNSWPSPIVIEVNGEPQIVTGADPWVIAYDPRDGSEIWKVSCLSGDVAPSPTYANGLVYFTGDGSCLIAIRPDGRGDVSSTHVAWKRDTDDYPDICSLLCDGPRLYTLVFGRLHAYDALSGEPLWEHGLEADFQASPSLVNGRLWLLTMDGEMIVGEADDEGFRETGRFPLGEDTGASPAFAPGRIYLRGKEHLHAIGSDAN